MKDKKILIVGGVVVVLAIIGLISWRFLPGRGGSNGSFLPDLSGKSGSFLDALSWDSGYECSYNDLISGNSVTVLASGDKVRIEGFSTSSNQGSGGVINDGTSIFIWDNSTKEGMSYNIQQMAEISGESVSEQASQWTDWKNWIKEQENNAAITCKPRLVGDESFNPPNEVAFTDLGDMLESMTNFQQSVDLGEGFSVAQPEDFE